MLPNEEEEDPYVLSRVNEDDFDDDELDVDLEGVESSSSSSSDDNDDDGEGEEEDLNLDSPSTSFDFPNIKSEFPSDSSTLPPPIDILPLPLPIPTTTTVANTPIVSVSTTTPTGAPSISPVISDFSPELKRQRMDETPTTITTTTEEKKPSTLDDSRRLFQRLWTDEDEIGLLQGFLDYIKQKGHKNSSYHHDIAPFYDQIKTKLQLDFNKNQLVEKLRRLKKKYRNVISRISSGKDFSFKSPHDQATFEISRKIWSDTGKVMFGEAGGVEEHERENPNRNNEISNHGFVNNSMDVNDSEKKVPRSRKRSRKVVEEQNLSNPSNLSNQTNVQVGLSIQSVIEDTIRSCLSPLFKELLNSAINGPCNVRGLGGMTLNPLPLNFGGNSSMSLLGGEMVDEKWRKQQILELEVYSKRIELVQDQIKMTLEKLKSMGSSSS